MKVREIINKINYCTARLPVYLQERAFGEVTQVESFAFADNYYPQKYDTVTSISIDKDRITIHYKKREE